MRAAFRREDRCLHEALHFSRREMRGLLSQICYEIDMRPVAGREKAVENKLDLDMTADTQ